MLDYDKISESMDSIVADSLENMFFLEVSKHDLFWASVKSLTPFKLKISVVFSEELMYDVAGEAFSMSPSELSDDMIKDIISEIANTISGKLMGSIIPASTPYSLDLPVYGKGEVTVGKDVVLLRHYFMNGKLYFVMVEDLSD